MQSTAVLNFAKSKNMKKKGMYPISGRTLICLFSSWLTAICLPVTLLQQGGMENISHLHFSQTFHSAVVGGHMQKGRDWILVSEGSGRNRLQTSLWKPPEYDCCPRAMACGLQLMQRVQSCSASTKTPWHSLKSQLRDPAVGNLSPHVYNLQSMHYAIQLC